MNNRLFLISGCIFFASFFFQCNRFERKDLLKPPQDRTAEPVRKPIEEVAPKLPPGQQVRRPGEPEQGISLYLGSEWEVRIDKIARLEVDQKVPATKEGMWYQVQMTLANKSSQSLPAPCFQWNINTSVHKISPNVVYSVASQKGVQVTTAGCLFPQLRHQPSAVLLVKANIQRPVSLSERAAILSFECAMSQAKNEKIQHQIGYLADIYP